VNLLQMHEPCAGKLSRTVLRGRSPGNRGLLPDVLLALNQIEYKKSG